MWFCSICQIAALWLVVALKTPNQSVYDKRQELQYVFMFRIAMEKIKRQLWKLLFRTRTPWCTWILGLGTDPFTAKSHPETQGIWIARTRDSGSNSENTRQITALTLNSGQSMWSEQFHYSWRQSWSVCIPCTLRKCAIPTPFSPWPLTDHFL